MENSQQRIRIGTKIFLIGASFALPIAVLVWFMVSSINENIDFANKEKEGTSYLRPLMAVQKNLHDYHEATEGCTTPDCAARASAAKTGVESALQKLEAEHQRHGESLQFTTEGLAKRGRTGMDSAKVRTLWTKLTSSNPATVDDYKALETAIRTVITHAGDTSNLILDPDLDSFYLMDAVVVAAPQMQDRLSDIHDLSLSLPANPEVAKTALAVDTAVLDEADYGRLTASTTTAMNEDPNFYGVSPTLRPRLSAALDKMATPTKQLLQQLKTSGADQSAIRELAATSRQETFAYWNTAVDELDQLLTFRIQSYEGQRTRALAVSGLSVLAASILAFLLMRSITIPLEKLVRSLAPGATLLTGCVERIAEVTKQQQPDPEEAGIICDELNAHADDMRKAVLELARQVRGAEADALAKSAAGYVE